MVVITMNSARAMLGIGLSLSMSFAIAGEDPGNSYLRELGPALTHARLSLSGTDTAFRCPENLNQFNGIPMATVFSYLSTADYVQGKEHTYFLTSPRPRNMLGGGFPQLTFVASADGLVEKVMCSYAR